MSGLRESACIVIRNSKARWANKAYSSRDIFIFDGGGGRLRGVTDLCCQCQIFQRRS
jgi:hypothetical protein